MLFWILWILGGLIFCRCPLFFYPTSDLPDLSAAPALPEASSKNWLSLLYFHRGGKSAKYGLNFRPRSLL